MTLRDTGGGLLPAGEGIALGYAWYALQGFAEPAEALLPRLRGAGFTLVETPRFAESEHRARLADAGLGLGAALTAIGSVDEARRGFDAAAAAGAAWVRCKLLSPHHPAAAVAAVLDAIEAKRDELALPTFIETHRDTATQDLAATADLLAVRPHLRLTLDVSHWRLGGDWPATPRTPREAERRALVLERVASLHLRVSDGERVQVPLTSPYAAAITAACATWAEAIAGWRARAPQGALLPVIAELLPPPYAEVDHAGRETTDRWQESIELARRIR